MYASKNISHDCINIITRLYKKLLITIMTLVMHVNIMYMAVFMAVRNSL